MAANAAFEVGPTERVKTYMRLYAGICAGIIMLEEMRPKYDSDANAGAWFARRTTRDVTCSSTRSSASSTCSS